MQLRKIRFGPSEEGQHRALDLCVEKSSDGYCDTRD
ncbi:MAG: hypothetical protein H6R26_2858 [Proteobacteria bacterium]|nr:hypothetical protein [Pseudomonadota bacterium]